MDILKKVKARIAYRYYRAVAKRILYSKPVVCGKRGLYEIHLLTCKRDLILTLWSLKTYFYFSGSLPHVFIHEDGSLEKEDIQMLKGHFLEAQIITREHADAAIGAWLEEYPYSREYRLASKRPQVIKVFDFHYFSKTKKILMLDPDILFFSRPQEMLTCLDAGEGFFSTDYQNAYSFSRETLKGLLHKDIVEKINIGIAFLPRAEIYDIRMIEAYAKLMQERNYPRPFWAGQTAFALLISNNVLSFKPLPKTYQISKMAATRSTVSHHYVNDGSRNNFYIQGVSRLVKEGFIDRFNRWAVA
jgi:hypothetical protein